MTRANKIVTIGIKIADLPTIKFNSLESLSPYDTIVFRPKCDTSEYLSSIEIYSKHWREELIQAYYKRKNIILLLPAQACYSTKDANRFDLLNNLPFPIDIRITQGTDIIPDSQEIPSIFKEFCNTFKEVLRYKYVINSPSGRAILRNKDKDILCQHIHGFVYGHIIILQDFFSDDMLNEPVRDITESSSNFKLRQEAFVKKYKDIAINLKKFIIKLTQELSETNVYFEQIPNWIDGVDIYDTEEEKACKLKINHNLVEITRLNEENKVLEAQKEQASILKLLLYATGNQLEVSVNAALNILGAKSEEYSNQKESLQIDNLIHYNNSIFVGEDKGLDGFSNNDDVGQLISNANQYYDMECSSEEDVPQKILFINSERKKELTERKKENCCSDKVKKLLKANSILVVWTPDLFFVAKYVKDTNDKEFAQKCMDCLFQNKYGIVSFPDIPKSD